MGFDRTPTDMIEDRQSGKRLDELMADLATVKKNIIDVYDYQDLKVVLGSDYDWAPAMNAALTACGINGGGKVLLPGGIIQWGQDINIPSGVILEGKSQSSITSTMGTQLKRIGNASINLIGTSILTGVPTRYNTFRDIRFNGNGFSTTDLVIAKAAGVVLFEDCFLFNTNARLFYGQELMDSRFVNTWFENGGSTDGLVPAMELVSGSGYEYTNQIMFESCRFEKYNGTALKTTGANTNEISFTDTKFESLISNVSHIVFSQANVINFNWLQVCSKGTVGNTLPSQIVFDAVQGVTGTMVLEHTGTIDTTAAKIDKFVDIKNGSVNIDLCVYTYTNGTNTIQTNPVMVDTANYSQRTTSIRGSVLGSAKTISNVSYAIPNTALIHGSNNPSIRLNYDPVTNEYWDLRVVSANGISEIQFIHGSGGQEKTVWKASSASELLALQPFVCPTLSVAPSAPRKATMYLDTNTNKMKFYNGTAWETFTSA